MPTQTNSIAGTGYGSPYIDSLIWGCGWTGVSAGTPLKYWFGEGSVLDADSSIGAFTGAAWSADEITAFENAIALYQNVCNLSFAEAGTENDADIVWWLAPESAMGAGSLGLHEVPDTSWTPIYGYFNYEDSSWSNLQQGSYGFITILHELGHGMGLAHPHDGGDHADATIFPGVRDAWSTGKFGLNQGIWTTMTYNDGWDVAPAVSDDYGYQGTLMALDIAALQELYGANMSTATGDDEYQLPVTQAAGTFWSCIWDADGTDTITNDGSSIDCTINLNPAPLTGSNAGGYVSRADGITGGFTIANGVTIENATGGSGNDVLIGNSADNILDGGQGSDKLGGGIGDDIYIVNTIQDIIVETSGAGIDTVQASTSWILGKNLENLTLTDTAANGTGNKVNNTLTGNDSINQLDGAGANDILIGNDGADVLIGGKGSDTFVYLALSDSNITEEDTISDFQGKAGDLIDLSAMDADSMQGGDQSFNFIGAATFSNVAGELRFAANTLSGDVDGDGAADFAVTLTGVTTLISDWIIE